MILDRRGRKEPVGGHSVLTLSLGHRLLTKDSIKTKITPDNKIEWEPTDQALPAETKAQPELI